MSLLRWVKYGWQGNSRKRGEVKWGWFGLRREIASHDICEGQAVGFLWGRAWRLYDLDAVVFLPWGSNVVATLIYYSFWRVRYGIRLVDYRRKYKNSERNNA